jgi:dTDP-4-dehydrorhamnose reductase
VRVLVTGAGGQLASELVSTAPGDAELLAVDRAKCDITEAPIVAKVFKSFEPDIVINAAAYTKVDEAEENEDLAFHVNARGAENVAKAADLVGARLIHISTDYVFDGRRSTPYPSDAATNPINVYGASKLEGERLVLIATPGASIIRAGWLYSMTGRNFVATVLAALHDSRPLSVVSDQEGCPTSAHEFAGAIWKMAAVSLTGVYHWANAGSGSWYDFAQEIAQVAQQIKLSSEGHEIRPVTTAEFPRRANRPAYSVLDPTRLAGELGLSPSRWQEALRSEMTRNAESLASKARTLKST